jgi:zinc transport system substrate-binding protein
MKKFIILSVGITVFCFFLYQTTQPSQSLASEKLKIAASFFPLAELARQVGGEQVIVTNMTPAGVEPHDYEPTPRDIVKVRSAKIFFMNGGNTDAWAEKIQKDLRNQGVEVVNMSENLKKSVELLKGQEEEEDPKEQKEVKFDPHFWLDPVLMQKQTGIVRDAFIKVDPDHTEYYKKTAAAYTDKLISLDQKYKDGLADCQLRDIVTAHASAGYLARRYNLEMLYISGLSPDEEPSPRRLANIATQARKKNIKYIFFETLLSPKLAETIAREIGAKTLVLNPIEGLTDEEIKAGKDYISIMEGNLNNLRIALQCK